MFAALAPGAGDDYFNLRWMFCFVGILCVGAVQCVLRIKNDNLALARGADAAARLLNKATGQALTVSSTAACGRYQGAGSRAS